MTYDFVKFEDRHARFESRITITGSYSIGLPTKFYRDNNIEDYQFAILFWDSKSKAIGIHFSNDEKEVGRIKIARTKDYGGMIAVKSFFTKNEIDPKLYKGRYEWEKIEQSGVGAMYVIKLPLG